MPKKLGIAIITLGAVLIIAALLLFFSNRQEATVAGQEAESLLVQVEEIIAAKAPELEQVEIDVTVTAEPEEVLDPEMPVELVDGYEYVGYVELPTLEIKLPVMAQWDYTRLQIAPCRQFGSSRTDDLVIAAHNYYTHFGRLKELAVGDTVYFTDMDGILNTYAVEKMDTIDPYNVQAVQDSGYDLVLYTCATGGQLRVTAFCNRTREQP